MKLINSKPVSAFGGLNFVIKEVIDLRINYLLNISLPTLPKQCKYNWFDIIMSYWSVFFCGGDCAEDLSANLKEGLRNTLFIKGIHSIVEFSAGIGGVDVSLTGECTDLYYSGRISSIKTSQFYAGRTELNLLAGAILSEGFNFSYAKVQNNNFVIGIGVSCGVGASASIVTFNINTGVSARNVAQARMFIRWYLKGVE